ncbi:uncharacterized protein LOC6565189 [Drosophila grimshawi]|uniref:GH12334 n=1 Tax=Drosophila grimshawi TaxID=7222 RepID=B4JJ45_DROGR|nr:uncharacterized protein LOC6565189 [Drosophila grimshawi]EDV99597.1 GH12334 [Drosophila grimshawi]
MKQNKSTQFERANKIAAYDNLDTDVENARKSLEHTLKYLSESNHDPVDRLRGKRSSEEGIIGIGGGSGSSHLHRGKHLNKQGTPSKFKEGAINMPQTRIRTPAMPTRLQSPRRNGLSPREDDDDDDDDDDVEDGDEDEDEVRKLQMEFEHQLQQGKSNGVGNRRIQVGALKQLNRPTYSCSSCGARFHIKSLLGAHRRIHDDDFKVRFRERRMRETVKRATAKVDNKQCKFCDRIFDLERAMRIHQLCHCTKITPQQRRKLGYTDLAHEKKNAPLPSFRCLPKSQVLPLHQLVADPSMPYVALGPDAIKMIEQEQQQQQQQLLKARRRTTKYTVKVAGPLGRWR